MRPFSLITLAAVLALGACKGEDVEDCTDGVDNDGDGNADCDDSECSAEPSCDEPEAEDCDNSADDDGDGDVDCDDSDCDGDAACEVDEDCGNGTDDDGDGDTDCDDSDCEGDDACLEPNPYTSYSGSEVFTYGIAAATADGDPAGEDCVVHWNATGAPRANNCPGCEFTFDVSLSYDETQSADNGTWTYCGDYSGDFTYAYAYTEDYLGYGPYALYEDADGNFAAWAAASFDGTNFAYTSGYVDYYYDNAEGYYASYTGAVSLTFYYDGMATLGQ